MEGEIKGELLKGADELINRSDREIMALSLGKNDRPADNYQMAMDIKLRRSMGHLKKSMDISSWIMIGLTVMLVVLTYIFVRKG